MESTRLRDRIRIGLLLVCLAVTANADAQALPSFYVYGGEAIEGVMSLVVSNEYPGLTTTDAATASLSGNRVTICVNRAYLPSTDPVIGGSLVALPYLAYGLYEVDLQFSIYKVGSPPPPCTSQGIRPLNVFHQDILTEVVEYYNLELDQYFITGLPSEIDALDRGLFHGWVRTGERFYAYLIPDGAPSTSVPVCRFYGRPEAGITSHFYSAKPSDCAVVLTTWPDEWQLEGMNVMRVFAMDPLVGCPVTSTIYYRMYNGLPNANHRYLPRDGIFDRLIGEMLTKGWILEGPAWCATPSGG